MQRQKSKHGIATPKQDIELVKKRLKIAQENCSYMLWYESDLYS
jgi:hypothetical protein